MYLLCIFLIVLASVLMCGIVLIQNSKGGGLASGFASSNQIMGVRKTTDFLEKATWALALFMAVVSVLAAYAMPDAVETEGSRIQHSAVENSVVNPNIAPDFSQEEVAVPAAEEIPAPATAE